MKARTRFGLVLALLLAQPSWGQGGAHARLGNGLSFFFKSPPKSGGSEYHPGVVTGGPEGVVRFIVDPAHGLYFGYQLRGEAIPDGRTVRIFVEPVSDENKTLWRHAAKSLAKACPACPEPAPLSPGISEYPEPVVVPLGSDFDVELLENPRTGEKVVDRVSVTLTPTSRLDELLVIEDGRLWVDGSRLQNPASCSGEIVYLYVPGQGRLLFSRRPRQGFTRGQGSAGAAADLSTDVLTATVASGHGYRWVSRQPIYPPPPRAGAVEAVAQGSYEVMATPFVRHEPTWRPPEGQEPAPHQYLAGAANPSEFPVQAEPDPARQTPKPRPLEGGYAVDVRVKPFAPIWHGDEAHRFQARVRDSANGALLLARAVVSKVGEPGSIEEEIRGPGGTTAHFRLFAVPSDDARSAEYDVRITGAHGEILYSHHARLPLAAATAE